MIIESPWKFFTLDELKCKCGKCNSTGLEMDNGFMQIIVHLRELLEFPFVISSGYRCKLYNAKISTTGETGPHTTGKAIDIVVRGESAYKLIKAALNIGLTGIGIKQKEISRFIHLDCLLLPDYPRPRIWSY